MAKFRRLTAAEARTLTRHEILDRIEAEQAYWHRKPWSRMSEADRAAEREFRRIMRVAIDPAAAIRDVTDYINGVVSRGNRYMDQHPDIPDAPEEDVTGSTTPRSS